MNDYAENCDYNCLLNNIKNVLREYFQYDDKGNPNENYNEILSAQDAIDKIHDIVGDI